MSHGYNQRLGGSAFNHGPSSDAEEEYDRLRAAARQAHGAEADRLNRQASEFIFRENNAVGKVAGDTIDLHGQFVREAEEILEQRIKYAQSTGQTHLHVIVGKGNHSPGHVQKIKPKVEEICRELGLQYNTEHNEGRIYINLQGGSAQQMPSYDYGQQHQPQHQNYGQPHYQTAYPLQGGQTQSYSQAAGGYPGHQNQQPVYAQQPGHPQQQMQMDQQQQQQQQSIECCGIKICVVM